MLRYKHIASLAMCYLQADEYDRNIQPSGRSFLKKEVHIVIHKSVLNSIVGLRPQSPRHFSREPSAPAL